MSSKKNEPAFPRSEQIWHDLSEKEASARLIALWEANLINESLATWWGHNFARPDPMHLATHIRSERFKERFTTIIATVYFLMLVVNAFLSTSDMMPSWWIVTRVPIQLIAAVTLVWISISTNSKTDPYSNCGSKAVSFLENYMALAKILLLSPIQLKDMNHDVMKKLVATRLLSLAMDAVLAKQHFETLKIEISSMAMATSYQERLTSAQAIMEDRRRKVFHAAEPACSFKLIDNPDDFFVQATNRINQLYPVLPKKVLPPVPVEREEEKEEEENRSEVEPATEATEPTPPIEVVGTA